MGTRIALGYLIVLGAFVGLWALFAPLSFYDVFPGCGRVWVSIDGPYNEHLVRDVGALNLSLAVLSGFGLFRRRLVQPLVVGWATLTYNLPHLVYHISKLGLYAPIDKAGHLIGLGLAVLASFVLIIDRQRVQS
jgi:hypothetical protein